MGAFESTRIHGCGVDILGTTHHIERWRYDLDLLLDAGIRTLRYSAPWHRIEQQPGVFDFSWLDQPLEYMRAEGLTPVLDPLHHTSFPDWLEGGLAHPQLPELYTRFLEQLVRRHPWIRDYTVLNEPFPTTLFCSFTGMWYPHYKSDHQFVKMALNVARTICQASAMLRERKSDMRLIHVDTCESHQAVDDQSKPWVEYVNQRRFLMHDLILGRVDRAHPLGGYLRTHGMTDADESWLQEHPAPFDMLGLDYYPHSEMEWLQGRRGPVIRRPISRPRGFSSLCRDYQARYRCPLLLTETNIRGSVSERISWLRFVHQQYDYAIAGGVDLRGFCWYPSIDTTDWSNCCTKATGAIDPQGIWSLGKDRWQRIATELSECYGALARGRITAAGLPAYRFGPRLYRQLRGYRRLMKDWNWIEPDCRQAA